MKKLITITVIIGMTALVLATASFARHVGDWQGSGGWGITGLYYRLYDPNTVITVHGEVLGFVEITPYPRMKMGLSLQLKTDQETFVVHLGPSWFIKNQDLKIAPKDTIEVTGSKIMFQGKPTIIATEIVKGDQVLKLRDKNGIPVWAGWRNK